MKLIEVQGTGQPLRWLIVEDALLNRQGHWFEYVGGFVGELQALGDEVTVLADRSAEPFLQEQLHAQPILPPSIWHRMGDGASALRRYLRVVAHAWQTYHAIRGYFEHAGPFDVVFVPTVMVHHLLGWVWLIRRSPQLHGVKKLLFFPNTPVHLDARTGEPTWTPAPTSKLFCHLIRSLREQVRTGQVILGVETHPMREALTELTGVPFTYFPHPVTPISGLPKNLSHDDSIVMGSYGSARHEKGSDCLVEAVIQHCLRSPNSRVRFVLQSVGGAEEHWGRLKDNPKVHLIPHLFAEGEYTKYLCATQTLLLPYRRSSYGLRVSRVLIEALVNGLPVVATRGTTLSSQAEQFGASVLCDDDNTDSLAAGIEQADRNHTSLCTLANQRKASARQHFSVGHFRELLSRTALLSAVAGASLGYA